MEERRLAHVELIESLSPITGADKIEVATVLGWQCVVKKGEFNVGQKIVYIEVDSVVPDRPEFEFLRDRKFRIRTIKLKGQVSQGLVIPLTIQNAQIGQDVTEQLGITKYLTPSEREEVSAQERKMVNEKNKLKKFMMRYSWFRRLALPRKQKSAFPYWVSKTDEERIQNIPKVLEQFKDEEVYVTEKVDYQSVTFTGKMLPNTTPIIGRFLPKKYKFIVCSRNMVTNDKGSLYWRIAEKYGIEKILRENPHLTIQGEQGDTKVQGNKYGIKEPCLWVFNIIDHEKGYHYNIDEMIEFCYKYGLCWVPRLSLSNIPVKLSDIGTTVQDVVEFSRGKSRINPSIEREGVVVRCIKNGQKILSFKVINPDFLLKFDA